MGERPATGILARDFHIQETPYFEDGNLEKARFHFKLALQELGLQANELPKITLSTYTIGVSKRLNQAIQEQWHQAFGIDVALDPKEWAVHYTKIAKGDFQVGQMQWFSWIYDPIYFLDTFRTKSFATNMSRWEHPKYQHLLDLVDYEVDAEKRREYINEAEALLMEEMPIIPLCFTQICYMTNPKLKGVYISPLRELDFRWAYFED